MADGPSISPELSTASETPDTAISDMGHKIAESLRYGTGRVGYSDYRFDADLAARVFKLDGIVSSDPEHKKIVEETNTPTHYMAKLREREILIEKLLPVVSTFPRIRYNDIPSIEKPAGYEAIPGSGESYGMEPEKLRDLAGLLMLATEGVGYKLLKLPKEALADGPALAAALESKSHVGLEFGDMCDSLRGEELVRYVTTGIKNNRAELEDRYNKQRQQNGNSVA